MGYLLYRNRNAIRNGRDKATEECLGFLYGCFKPDLFWFEMVWLLRRLLLVAALAVIPEDNAFRAPSVVAILVASLAVHHAFKPLNNPKENFMEGLGLLALLVTYAVGVAPSSNDLTDSDALETVLLVANLIASALFVGLMCRPFVAMLREKVGEHRAAAIN